MRATSSSLRRSRHTPRLARLSRGRAAVLGTPPPATDQRIAPPPHPPAVAAPIRRALLPPPPRAGGARGTHRLTAPGAEGSPQPAPERRDGGPRGGRQVLVPD